MCTAVPNFPRRTHSIFEFSAGHKSRRELRLHFRCRFSGSPWWVPETRPRLHGAEKKPWCDGFWFTTLVWFVHRLCLKIKVGTHLHNCSQKLSVGRSGNLLRSSWELALELAMVLAMGEAASIDGVGAVAKSIPKLVMHRMLDLATNTFA